MQLDVSQRHGQRWRNRPLVLETDRHGYRRLLRILLVVALLVTPYAVYVMEQGACLELAYELSALREESQRLEERERRLRVERAALQTLGTVEPWAVNERGLRPPLPEQVVVLQQLWEPEAMITAQQTRPSSLAARTARAASPVVDPPHAIGALRQRTQ
jgi:cell division protein FtsL